MKIVFMGTPDFARDSLSAIYDAGHEISAVITVPDKPKGRGMKLIPCEVKEYAIEKNIKVYQPEKLRENKEIVDILKNINPDVICVVAYGKIIPKEILEIPKYGCVNVHPSLLPQYRGSAPIQWAILNGDKETGVTTMYLDEGMDSGDIILQTKTSIDKDETSGELWDRLSKIGAELLVETLEKIENKIKTLDINVQKQCYQQLKIITMNELEKYKHAYFEYDPGYDLQQYLEKKIIEELPPRNININNMLEEVDPITGKKGGEIIGEAIGDIKELDEYPSHSSSIHGQKHINNVVLFSYLIAKGEKQLVGDDLDLVIQAAKYHDVGRDGIWNGLGDGNREDGDEVKHANPSALAAEFYMNKEKNKDGSKKYNEQQIAMVQTAISYHEVNEKNHNEFNEEVFEQLCDKYNVDKKNNNVAKLICIYLKDADAVDRTRFMQDYEEDRNTIPEHRRYERRFYDGLDISYLRAPTSFYIVDEARKIHKEYLRKGCEQVFDEHGNYLENVSPKISIPEILKPYEYSIKNKTKDINNKGKIKKFLNDKQKEEEQEELKEFSKIYYDMDKSLLAKLRRRGKQILEKIRYVGKEKTR